MFKIWNICACPTRDFSSLILLTNKNNVMNVVYWLFLETLSGVQIFFEMFFLSSTQALKLKFGQNALVKWQCANCRPYYYFSKSHVAKLMAYFIHDFMYDRVSSNLNFNFISWQNICKKYVVEAEAATRGVL